MTSPRLLRPHSLRLRSIIAAISSLKCTVNAFLLPVRAIRALLLSQGCQLQEKSNPRRREGVEIVPWSFSFNLLREVSQASFAPLDGRVAKHARY